MFDAKNCIKLENRQMQMNLLEGTHYRRRFYQPSPLPHKSKEFVSCLFFDMSSYLVEHVETFDGRSRETAHATTTATFNYQKTSDITKIRFCYR